MERIQSPLEVYMALLEWIEAGKSFAYATILQSDGSTPQKNGVKALIEPEGRILGTLGGGLLEGEAIRLSAEACRSLQPSIFEIELNDPYARDAGPICGGSMRVLLDPRVGDDKKVFERLVESLVGRRRGLLLTRIEHSHPLKVGLEWVPEESVSEAFPVSGAEELLRPQSGAPPKLYSGRSQASATQEEILVEPIVPNPMLLVLGGGHVGQAVAFLAVWNGFDVTVIEDRPEFARADLFPPEVAILNAHARESLATIRINRETYIVLVNRGHKQDAEALERCIHSDAAYVGMIGSRRKVALIRKDFVESGLATEEEFDRIHAPIGLDIGSVTVPEIATSILAELISARRGRSARTPSRETVDR